MVSFGDSGSSIHCGRRSSGWIKLPAAVSMQVQDCPVIRCVSTTEVARRSCLKGVPAFFPVLFVELFVHYGGLLSRAVNNKNVCYF